MCWACRSSPGCAKSSPGRRGEKRYDKLAKEFTKLLTSAYATTALFGGILLFLLISFYPKLMNYLTDIFFPSFIVYCLLFLVETATLYLYWYGWDAMQDGGKKTFHIFLGFLLNFFAFFIMIVPNSWATFQASPVVLAEGSDIGAGLGRDLESNLVAGEHSPFDCERRARRLHLWRLCRDSLFVGQEHGRARPLRLDGLCRELHRRIRSVAAPFCRLLAHA